MNIYWIGTSSSYHGQFVDRTRKVAPVGTATYFPGFFRGVQGAAPGSWTEIGWGSFI